MKKIILLTSLFLTIFFILSPTRVNAACFIPMNAVDRLCLTDPSSMYTPCLNVGGDNYCCDSQPSCDALKSSQPTCSSKGGTCVPSNYVCVSDWGQLGCGSGQKCGTKCGAAWRYNCDLKGGCVQDTSGTYATLNECAPACRAQIGSGGLLCGNDSNGISTAIGCIPVLNDTNAFAGFILKWAVGVGGGIAFLLIVYAGFMIMTSQGNPERLKAGQELLTAAISGVILLVLSVFVLNIIGIKILQIPGL